MRGKTIKEIGISDDSVRHCEEGSGARTKGERRNRDECVGRVKVAADKEPDDNSAKRRPPRPHSCSKSRSPLRHLAAAKPNQVIKANNIMKIIRESNLRPAQYSPSKF